MSPDPDRVSAGVRRYEVTTIRLDEKRCYDVTTYDVTTYDVTTYDAICCDVTMLRCYDVTMLRTKLRRYDDTNLLFVLRFLVCYWQFYFLSVLLKCFGGFTLVSISFTVGYS